MEKQFPIIKAGHIFNKFNKKIKCPILNKKSVEIKYPCRLDAMAINPAAVCYNDSMVFTPGEVVFSLAKYINVKVEVLSPTGGKLIISKKTRRKVLVKHSYLIMCDALKVNPSLKIDINDNDIPKHCGFGSSSSTIAAVAAAINELYDCSIENSDLIKYLASNHAEEISDDNENELKVVQCIGGGATNGLTEEGIILISGKSTTIAKMKYESKVLVCIPSDYVEKDAKELMELEEQNLWKFKKTGEEYAENIAYTLLHKAIPSMYNGSIKDLADLVFDYRFNMGSNENCSFVYDGLMNISNKIRKLYENNKCNFLALSSVGPAFFLLVDNNQEKECIKELEKINLKVIKTKICNTKYIVKSKENKAFWQNEKTNEQFQLKPPSKYITKYLDILDLKNKMCIDVGCGGGRYSRYLDKRKAKVIAIDKYKEMFSGEINKGINFVQGDMSQLPVLDNTYDLALSIGVIHNALSKEKYINAFNELYRILKKEGILVVSIFTNDVITSDLKKVNKNFYEVEGREPMCLYSKNEINNLIKKIGFNRIKKIDEHVTDVGSGKRNVYTFIAKK